MKLTDIEYNKLKDLLNSAKISKPKEYEELKETAPGVYKTKGYVGGHHKMTYYSLDNTELKKYLNGHINKKRGIKNEDKIIKEYSKKYNKKITDNNSKLYKIHLFDIEKYKIYICGKIDGIENDELIEVKNRKNRLFTFIPEYEQIQIQIYFKLTGLSTGKLIQNYNDEQSILSINEDNHIWDIIIQELNIVSHKIIQLL